MKRSVIALLFFIFLVTIWQFLVTIDIWPSYLVPSPLEVLYYLTESFGNGTLEWAIFTTLKRLFLGYLVSVIIGIPLGLLIARYELLEDTLGTLALGLQTLPSVCWAPLAILWFGQTEKAMFFIVLMGSLFSIVLATAAGVHHVPPIYVHAAKTMGAKGKTLWCKVMIPASLPFILTGMKQGWAFAWRSLMAAEIYITIITGFGLGHLLHYGRELHAMDAVLAIMLIIIVIGLVVDKIVFSPLESFVYHHWGTAKNRS